MVLLGRMGIAIAFGVPAVFPLPATGWVAVALGTLALVFVGGVMAWRAELPLWGRVWLLDFGMLGLWAPVLVLTTFVGRGGDEVLLPSEQSMYVQIALLAVVIWIGLTAAALRLVSPRYELAGVLLLPGACLVPGVAAVSGELRSASAAGALAAALLTAALATAPTLFAGARLQKLIPLAAVGLFTLGAAIYAPRASMLIGSQFPVAFVRPLLLSGVCVTLAAGFASVSAGFWHRRRPQPQSAPREDVDAAEPPRSASHADVESW